MRAIFRPKPALVLALLFAALLAAFWSFDLRLNFTPSLPAGVYRLSRMLPADPLRGGSASFCLEGETARTAMERGYLQTGLCPSGVQPLVKIVAGLPGDFLVSDSLGIRVNGRLWPNSRPLSEDGQGRQLTAAQLPDRIPAGMVLMLSLAHEGGFDSRYFGLVPQDSLDQAGLLFAF
ncbi:MAG: conjugative transfer signal peptidase TraF [Desulfovibrio sp.]|nr:conjugative transfer signal peptidase TraF [Desulfovibrio sp.]